MNRKLTPHQHQLEMNRKRKVIFVTHYGGLGGANRSMLALIAAGIEKGYKFHVILLRPGPLEAELRSRGIPHKVIYFSWCQVSIGQSVVSRNKSKVRRLLEFAKLREATRMIKSFSADLIHTNSSLTDLGYILSKTLSLPHVWHVREFGEADYELSPLSETNLGRALHNSSVITVSYALATHLEKRYKIRPDIVYNGVINSSDLPRERNHTQTSSNQLMKFAMFGGVSSEKGVDVAINALAILRSKGECSELFLFGEGDIEWARSVARSLNVEPFVKFEGWIDNIYDRLPEFDCLLNCSKSEAMGRSTAEAMIVGVPVIANNAGGSTELLGGGLRGDLYDSKPELLAEAMRNLRSSETAKKTNAARTYALQNFTESVAFSKVECVYQNALAKHSSHL